MVWDARRRTWGQGLQVTRNVFPFTFALFPARALDPKLCLKQELYFPPQISETIFPVTGVLGSIQSLISQGLLKLPAQSTIPGGGLPQAPPLTVSSAQMNQNILWSDRTQQIEAWFLLCAWVLCTRNHYFSLDWGHFLPSFTADL